MSEVVQTYKGHTDNQQLTLSDNAVAHVKRYLQNRGHGIGMRLGMSKTGCSGLQYVVDYVDEISDTDVTFTISEDLVLVVAKKDFPYLQGTHIDYRKQGINEQFVFQNPNETGACGCGESFTVD